MVLFFWRFAAPKENYMLKDERKPKMEEKLEIAKDSKMFMIRQGCGLILASLALFFSLSSDGSFWEFSDMWGMDMFVMVSGLAAIFFIAGKSKKQKHICLNIACCLFALCTILGRSFMETGSWNILISDKIQVCRAFLIWGGGIT